MIPSIFKALSNSFGMLVWNYFPSLVVIYYDSGLYHFIIPGYLFFKTRTFFATKTFNPKQMHKETKTANSYFVKVLKTCPLLSKE